MSLNTPATTHTLGRTFLVAASVLGAVAVLQLGAVSWAFFTKRGAAVAKTDDAPAAPLPKIDLSNFPVVEPDEPLSVSNDPIIEARPFTGKPEPLRIEPPRADRSDRPLAVPENPGMPPVVASTPGSMLRPTPVPLSAFTPKQDPRFSELVEQGKLLRNTGDTAGALVKFREAAVLEPANPLPIAETAYTFERMSLNDKASEQWRRILAMGENAGVYFSAAQAKLNMAIADTTRTVSPSGASSSNAPIPEGKMLAISVPRLEDDSDPSSAKKFTLHVPIRAKQGQEINVRDMKVFVLFYERLNGKDIVRTSANVSNRWENPPIDWTEGEETLEVSYDLPPNDGRGEPRTYYGYIIRLYYQGELQDTQALPALLNQKFPAESQLSE